MPFVCSAIIICVIVFFVYKRVIKKTKKTEKGIDGETPNQDPLLSSV